MLDQLSHTSIFVTNSSFFALSAAYEQVYRDQKVLSSNIWKAIGGELSYFLHYCSTCLLLRHEFVLDFKLGFISN